MWTSFPDQILGPLYGVSLKMFRYSFFRDHTDIFQSPLKSLYPFPMAMKFSTLTDFGLFK